MGSNHKPASARILPKAGALAAGLLIAAWFLYFARWGLRAEFTHDDLMNCHRAVFYPLGRLLGDILLFFRPSDLYRPLPALAYRAFFHLSGFDLFPFRLLLTAVMGLNVFLLYAFARRLTASRQVALLASLLSAVHINIAGYYFNTGQIYDIFCYSFYFGALTYYLRVRLAGRPLRASELALFCGLYALALDSKELAVSLPAVVGAWELLHTAPWTARAGWRKWLRRDLLPVWITGAMTLAYIPGRVLTQSGIASAPGYKMQVSFPVYLQNAGLYLNELFYGHRYFDAPRTLALALLLPAAALWTRSRTLAVCWVLYFAGLLPVAFIAGRGLTAAWIPTAGLLICAACAAVGLQDALLRACRGSRWRPAAQVALFLLAGLLMIRAHTGIRNIWNAWQQEYASIRNLRQSLLQCCPNVPRGASMLFLKDPLNETYSTVFLVQLLYRDPTSKIDQAFRFEKPPSPVDIAAYDFLFDVVDGKLVRLDPLDYARRLAAHP
jgi:hypothetical protein